MANFPSESVRIMPVLFAVCTAGISTGQLGNNIQKVRYMGNGPMSVIITMRCGSASEASGITATAAANVDFSIVESTAATSAGSAITGATLTLGAATAGQVHGALNAALTVSTALATSTNIVINGTTYHSLTAGATATPGASMLARVINGQSTANSMPKLPHYTAHADAGAAAQVWILGDDDMGTGLDISGGAATGQAAVDMVTLQGVIDIPAYKFSTNNPKWIGIAATVGGAATAGPIAAYIVTYPTGGYGTPGRRVSLAT